MSHQRGREGPKGSKEWRSISLAPVLYHEISNDNTNESTSTHEDDNASYVESPIQNEPISRNDSLNRAMLDPQFSIIVEGNSARVTAPWDSLSRDAQNRNIKRSLYVAAIMGDEVEAQRIVENNPDIVRVGLTVGDDTALHIAISTNNTKFAFTIMSHMTKEDLELRNKEGNTSLCIAAVAGNLGLALDMVKRNPTLPMITGREGMTPCLLATLTGRKKMMQYLYGVTDLQKFLI